MVAGRFPHAGVAFYVRLASGNRELLYLSGDVTGATGHRADALAQPGGCDLGHQRLEVAHHAAGVGEALDEDRLGLGRDGLAHRVDVVDDELGRKRRALGEHASQTGPLAALMGEDTYRTWWRSEWFRRPSPKEATTCGILCPSAAIARAHGDEVPA